MTRRSSEKVFENIDETTISVIVPVYNVEKYVGECITSVLPQLEANDELIIVDDGSTDQSAVICKRLIEGFSNTKFISQTNKGLSEARNAGLAVASCDYVMFLDSDDYLRDDAINTINKALIKSSPDMLLFDVLYVDEYRNVKANSILHCRKNFIKSSQIISGQEMFVSLYPRYYETAACLTVVRKNFLDDCEIKFVPKLLHEDAVFTFISLMKADSTYHIAQQIYVYRRRENSITTTPFNEQRWLSMMKVIEILTNYIADNRHTLARDVIYCAVHNCYDRLIEAFDGQFQYYIEKNTNLSIKITQKFLSLWSELFVASSLVDIHRAFELKEMLSMRKITSKEITDILKSIKLNDLENIYKQNMMAILSKIPFKDKNIRLGIYGTGKHTEKLLKYYQEYMGEILCDYFFVDSFIPSGEKSYMGKPVFNIRNVKGKADMILISTFRFIEDFNKNVDEFCGNDFKRINIYTPKDKIGIFSN